MSFCKTCSSMLLCSTGDCVCGTCGTAVGGSTPNTEGADTKNNKMPSAFQQAKNLAKSVYNHAANGAERVPEHIYKSRIQTCEGCDQLSKGRCFECGCFVKAKAAWGSEMCPIGKWGQYKRSEGKCGGCGGK